MKPFIIISPGRSASSWVAKQFHDAGVFGGEMRKGDRWNPEGYFENIQLHKALRQWYGQDWVTGDFPEAVNGWGNFVHLKLLSEGYRGGPWFFKCGTFYYDTFKPFDPVYVKVWRDPYKILKSFKNCGFLNRFTESERQTIIERQHEKMREIEGLDIHV